MRWVAAIAVAIIATLVIVATAQAQSLYGQRLQSNDGSMVLPVATRLLCSDSTDHTNRGSIPSWDLCVPKSTPIFAAAPGVVILAACELQAAHGYGCWVKLDHGNGITTSYAHMVQGSIMVQRGQRVDANTVLGLVGWTGKTSFGPHVHWVIQVNGQHIDPARLFNQAMMQYCKLCASPAGNAVPVGVVSQAQPQTTQRMVNPVIVAIAGLTVSEFYMLTVITTLVILALLWLANNAVRVVMVAGMVATICATAVLWLASPTTVTATAPTASATWEQVYPIIQRMEGWACTNDGAYTMGGVTQGTYNRWRAKHGMGQADVCANLTREQAKAIYYELFWLPTGADRMPAAMALTVVDHYVNTGEYKDGLTQCGMDFDCFNQWRLADYATKRNYGLYGQAWRNRVTRIIQAAKVAAWVM